MPTEVSLFGGNLPFEPAAAEEKLAFHTNFNSQWILLRILAQLVGQASGAVPALPSTATASPSRYANLGGDPAVLVKAAGGNVFSATCHNENAAARYFQLHNKATVPLATEIPLYTFLVPAGAQIIVGTDFFTANGAHFTNGIGFAFSTTKDTYTAATGADQTSFVHYK